jgi:hypothetical protein
MSYDDEFIETFFGGLIFTKVSEFIFLNLYLCINQHKILYFWDAKMEILRKLIYSPHKKKQFLTLIDTNHITAQKLSKIPSFHLKLPS